MMSTVYGVDFSGAKKPGPTTWVARLRPVRRGGRKLRLDDLVPMSRLCKPDTRAEVLGTLVRLIRESEASLWALNFPFGLPVEVMPGCKTWGDQFAHLKEWGEEAYACGVACYERGLALGGPGHVRRLTDAQERTPFDAYHYRIIYQTFYGMRDVLGPLRRAPRTAILPFQHRRLTSAERVLVEACPASTLLRMGLPHQNYKQAAGGPLTPKRRRTRRAILDGLAPHVELAPTFVRRIMRDPGADSLDAVLCGVGAWRCWREYDHAAIGRHPRYRREGCHYA